MTKAEFYEQRKQTFRSEYKELKKTMKRDEALEIVCKNHNAKYGLVEAVVFNDNYLKKKST